MKDELIQYKDLLVDIKTRVRQGQIRASFSANSEMLATYWDIGKIIHERQQSEGWGKSVIPRLANDLKNELSDIKGFSERNIRSMVAFYSEYTFIPSIWQLPVAKLKKPSNQIVQPAVAQLKTLVNDYENLFLISWTHHIILIQKIKNMTTRYWYMQQIINNGLNRDSLEELNEMLNYKSNKEQNQ